MAQRPVFVVQLQGKVLVRQELVTFEWHAGMSVQQKQKSIRSLHEAAAQRGIYPILEISTKSGESLGRRLSAFNLTTETQLAGSITIEAAYQGGKVFERGGPYLDLYRLPGREIKADKRLRESGGLIAFEFEGVRWPLEPKTVFYDWLYITGLKQNPELSRQLLPYAGFSDIEFNPEKAINCQARAAALFVGLIQRSLLEEMTASQEAFIRFVQGQEKGDWGEAQAQQRLIES